MEQLTSLIPIALITGLVELVKITFDVPDKFIRPIVFLLALLFAIIGTLNKDLTQTIVSILTYALGASGLFSFVVKPIQNLNK